MSAVTTLIAKYRGGSITFDELQAAFVARKWPEPVKLADDAYDISFGDDDGSWRDVWKASRSGRLTKGEYAKLSAAVTSR